MLADTKFDVGKNGVSVSLGKKKINIGPEIGVPTLNLTNEYGNSLCYKLTGGEFKSLHAVLWQFVRASINDI